MKGRRSCAWIVVLALALEVLLCVGLLLPAHADGPQGTWQPLQTPRGTEEARVTFYGPQYGPEDVCNSGRYYNPHGWFVAVGPSMLRTARALSGEEWPTIRLVTDEWAAEFPVWDTGGSTDGVELEVDLPDATWLDLSGLPADAGLFYARVEVLTTGRKRDDGQLRDDETATPDYQGAGDRQDSGVRGEPDARNPGHLGPWRGAEAGPADPFGAARPLCLLWPALPGPHWGALLGPLFPAWPPAAGAGRVR